MDKGDRQAIVPGVTRIGHDLETKPPTKVIVQRPSE